MDRIATGIAALDKVMCGGFPKGSTNLIVGRPGSGKTILAHQIMFYNAAPENKALYMTTMAEPQVKVIKFQQEFDFFDQQKFQRDVIYQDLGSVLRKHGPKHALVLIDELIKKHEPSLVVIDTIKTIADMIPSLVEFREFLLDLSVRMATWSCTAMLLGEYSEEDIEIRPESAISDGIIYLSGAEERKHQKRYLRILKMRGTGYIGGENIFKITRSGIDVFPRLKPEVTEQPYQQFNRSVSTGFPELDEMACGGVRRGSTTIISGSSGTGKTIIALHFIYAGLQNDESAIFISYEENPWQLIAGAKQLGLDLTPYLENGKLALIYASPVELDVDEHIYEIQQKVNELKADRLVIDSISSFEIGMADKVKYTDYIWALADYFKNLGVTLLMTHEMHDNANISVLTKHGISFVADNLILLRYLEELLEVRRFIRIVKMRGSNHSTIARELKIENNRLTIGGSPSR